MKDSAFQIAANTGSLDLDNFNIASQRQEGSEDDEDLELSDSSFHSIPPISGDVSEADEEFSRRPECLDAKAPIMRDMQNNSPFSSLVHKQDEIDMFNKVSSDDALLSKLGRDEDSADEEGAQTSSLDCEDTTSTTLPEDQFTIFSDGHYNDKSLAIAVEVSLDEKNDLIPRAVEYAPKSTPPLHANRRFRLCILSTIMFFLLVGIVTIVFLMAFQHHIEEAPSVSPTWQTENAWTMENIIEVVGKASLTVDGSPYAEAADWILNKDPLQLSWDAENLIQRYLLVFFYFATTQRRPWKSCNPASDNETAECNYTALLQTFPQLQYELIPKGRWLSGKHECEWAGITCDNFNRSRAIELPGQDIVSTLPSDLAMISSLQSISLSWNEFYGTVPAELFHMKELANLELHYNLLTGQLPSSRHNTNNLQRIVFAGNLFSGTIPTGFTSSRLRGLYIQDNQISGTIPTEIGRLPSLSFLRCEQNFMTGTLPSEIGKLSKIQEMWLHRNNLAGKLPREIGNMLALIDLRLHFNLFNGSIPQEHYSIPQLRRWDIQNCNFTGTISTLIGHLSTLQTYRIRNNNFYGTIPSEMGELQSLSVAWLHNNNLTGTMPQQVCSLRSFGGVSYIQVDCDNDNPLVNCTCCESSKGMCGD